jgi:SNF2 family DNA or RNA helicase
MGTLSFREMAPGVDDFYTPDGPDVMHLTGASGQGITITEASVVVMLGVGCNHSRDHQVPTQVYREGQTWDVKVICLVQRTRLANEME